MNAKKILKGTGIALASLAVLYGALAVCPRPDNYKSVNTMRTDSDLPILIAHGGGNREFPDNTLEAFWKSSSPVNSDSVR
ncbi:MAG: hypothetical protein IKU40_00250 [Clostridia bacterium]|nr:hypothetical protein [Clostridia bacterium]